MPKMWIRSFFVSTAGNVSSDTTQDSDVNQADPHSKPGRLSAASWDRRFTQGHNAVGHNHVAHPWSLTSPMPRADPALASFLFIVDQQWTKP
jgi:hypothetical protein